MTNEHTSLEKYTSHTLFSKGLRKGWCWIYVRVELETKRDCHILTPSSSDHSSTSSSFCLAAQPGSLRAQAGSHSAGILSPTATGTLTRTDSNSASNSNCLQLELNSLKPSVAPGYIIVWHQPASRGRKHLHRIQPRLQFKVIFRYLRPDAPVSWLTAQPGSSFMHLIVKDIYWFKLGSFVSVVKS